MRLSRAVYYAIKVLRELAQDEEVGPPSSPRLTKKREMPERCLLQILDNLVEHGILVSVRNVNGTYMAARPLEQISLLDVIEAIEGPVAESIPDCLGPLDDGQSNLRAVCVEIAAATRDRLSRVTVAEL